MSPTIDVAAYQTNGFTIIPDVFTRQEMHDLKREVLSLCRGGYGPIQDLTPCPAGTSDAAALRRYIACHVVHKALPMTRDMLADRRVVDPVCQLIGPNVKCVHSVLFFKGPGSPGNAWHQDELFIPTRDRSLTTAWISIDDVDTENGCLRFLPGSHTSGILWPMKRHNDPDLDRAETAYGFPYTDADGVPIEIGAGSVALFDGYTLHGSFPNRSSDRFRHSVQFVYMRAESLLPWDQVTRDHTTDDYRDIIMVNGTDPYAWKGIADLGSAYMRTAGPTKADLRAATAQ